MRPTAAAPTTPPCARPLHAAEDAGDAPALLGHLVTAHASLLDAVRLPLAAALGTDVRLRVLRLRVDAGWAFVEAEPQDGDCRALDLIGSRREARLCALARADRDGRWRVVAYALDGRLDRCARWPARFGVPAALLPLTWPARVRARASVRAAAAHVAAARAA
jgi:hypothetical protein